MKRIFCLSSLLLSYNLFAAEAVTTYYYGDDQGMPVKPELHSDHNRMWALYPPSQFAFEKFMHDGVVSQGEVTAALANHMASAKSALIYATYHDNMELNASKEVFNAYEYASFSRGMAGRRRAYIAFPDFLLRSKNYDYIIENIDPELCYQNKKVCAYYRVAAMYLKNGWCDVKWLGEALKFTPRANLLLQKCKGVVR